MTESPIDDLQGSSNWFVVVSFAVVFVDVVPCFGGPVVAFAVVVAQHRIVN